MYHWGGEWPSVFFRETRDFSWAHFKVKQPLRLSANPFVMMYLIIR
jgi:hypothetical protein